jgi:CRISPR-associated protein Cas1
MGYLLVRNETETFVFADEVLNLIIESNQTIVSTELLNQMVKRNVNIIFCDEKHLPTSQLVGLNNNFSTSKNILIQIN